MWLSLDTWERYSQIKICACGNEFEERLLSLCSESFVLPFAVWKYKY